MVVNPGLDGTTTTLNLIRTLERTGGITAKKDLTSLFQEDVVDLRVVGVVTAVTVSAGKALALLPVSFLFNLTPLKEMVFLGRGHKF